MSVQPGPQKLAGEVIRDVQAMFAPQSPLLAVPQRPPLTSDEQKALDEAAEKDALCKCCSGVHAGTELACPRLASFTLNGDGRLTGGTYWPHGQWVPPRMSLTEDAGPAEDDPGE